MDSDYKASQHYLDDMEGSLEAAIDSLHRVSQDIHSIEDMHFGKPSNMSGYVFEDMIEAFRKMLGDIKKNVYEDYRSAVEYDYPAPPEEEEESE